MEICQTVAGMVTRKGVIHPPLVLGEKFFVVTQSELQDDLGMSYQECQGNLWSLLQLKQKKI